MPSQHEMNRRRFGVEDTGGGQRSFGAMSNRLTGSEANGAGRWIAAINLSEPSDVHGTLHPVCGTVAAADQQPPSLCKSYHEVRRLLTVSGSNTGQSDHPAHHAVVDTRGQARALCAW